jgi:hypothetical protein
MSFPFQCATCRNYLDDLKCKAFPKRIPNEILTGKRSHTRPYPGDNGILYDPEEKIRKLNEQWEQKKKELNLR